MAKAEVQYVKNLGEYVEVLTKTGEKTGILKPREDVHRDGDYHGAVNVWIFAERTQEFLLQQRSHCKDSWPGLWDTSTAGHISAGESSLTAARREVQEELGVTFPKDAFEMLFVIRQESVTNDGKSIDHEHLYIDVYLVTTLEPIPLEAFCLQESEVSAVKYVSYEEYKSSLAKEDPNYVPYDVNGHYGQLFDIIVSRYKENTVARSLILQKQQSRYAPVSLNAELTGLTDADRDALAFTVKAAVVMDELYYLQVWCSNPVLRDWLKKHAGTTELDKLKYLYYLINKGPWSRLDENCPFLTTADSAIRLLSEATKPVKGWKGLEYRVAIPILKPPGANFYPADLDKKEFEKWKDSLEENQQKVTASFFTVIKRHSEIVLDSYPPDKSEGADYDLHTVPYSQEYESLLVKAAELLHKAGDMATSPCLKKLLHSKADAFLSNDYYDSDIAWLELDSKLDVTIGPYETYEDKLFGFKATFEAYVGVRDDEGTARLKLFGDNLQVLEQNLPIDDVYKSKDVNVAAIRVIQLIYSAGMNDNICQDPRTQAAAFNLPNDERIVKDRRTSMVIIKNASEAKFQHILRPIADVCLTKEQQVLVDFDSFFTHIICQECCHGIGPHIITLPNAIARIPLSLGRSKSRYSWPLGIEVLDHSEYRDLLSKSLLKSVYVSFLVECFRSIRFGLTSAHGKGQALQFNWLYEKGAYVLHSDETFSVDFSKIDGAVETLSKEILTIQAKGDKEAAGLLLQKYAVMTEPLKLALEKLENVQVPVDIAPTFPIANNILD